MSSISVQWKDPKEIPQKYCKLVLTINQDWHPTPHLLWGVVNVWNPLEKKFCLAYDEPRKFGVPRKLPDYCHVLAWDYDPTDFLDFIKDAYKGDGFKK